VDILDVNCVTSETTMRAATKAKMDYCKRLAEQAVEESNDEG
jgi:hypothetical protein